MYNATGCKDDISTDYPIKPIESWRGEITNHIVDKAPHIMIANLKGSG